MIRDNRHLTYYNIQMCYYAYFVTLTFKQNAKNLNDTKFKDIHLFLK